MQQEEPPPATVPPPTDAERMWAHYQKPQGSSWPADRMPMRRWEWLRLVQRLAISTHVKAVAAALAAFCDGDGSNVVTTDPSVYHGLGISERQLRTHVAVLRDLKLLHVVEHGGGRGRARKHGGGRRSELNANAIVCQLTEPADGALPYRLDGGFLPIDERPKGNAPAKAIEASRAARTANSGSRAAAESGARTPKQRKPGYRSNAETAEAGLPENGANSGSGAAGVSGPDERNSGSWASGEGCAELANSGSPASAVSGIDGENSGSAATGVSPVDNAPEAHGARKPGFHSSSETPEAGLPKLRKPDFQNSGSPASVSVFKTLENLENPTTRVVSLGGDLTSDAAPEPQAIDPEFPEPHPADEPRSLDAGHTADEAQTELVDEPAADEFDPAAIAANVPPTPVPDLEYDRAREILNQLDPAELGDRLSDAQSELEAEAAAAWSAEDDGVTVYADGRQIVIRAARIVQSTQPTAPPLPQPGADR